MLSHTKEIGTPPLFIMVGLAPEILRGKRKLAFLALLPGIHYTIKMVNKYSFLQVNFCKKPKFSKTKIENWNWVQFMNSSFIFPSLLNLKNIFSWNSITQKMNEIFDKSLHYEVRAEFCQIFRSFFGQWCFKKKCFWDLLTFKMHSVLRLDATHKKRWMEKLFKFKKFSIK